MTLGGRGMEYPRLPMVVVAIGWMSGLGLCSQTAYGAS